jgi:hypothetical protein
MSILNYARHRYPHTERSGQRTERKSIGRSLFEAVATGQRQRAGQTIERGVTMRYRRWFVAIATTMAAISLQGRAPALSKDSLSASITQSETASITAHGGGATLQDCMALWDAATHMSKQEWKAACKRTMVFEFRDNAR